MSPHSVQTSDGWDQEVPITLFWDRQAPNAETVLSVFELTLEAFLPLLERGGCVKVEVNSCRT